MTKPKSAVVQKLDEVQARLDQILKPIGFRRRGRIYNRSPESDLIKVVGIQAGPYEFDAEAYGHPNYYGKLAINLGVWIREFHDRSYEGFYPKTVSDAYCEIRTRLERLDGRAEFSWSTTEPTDELADEIAALMIGVGVPWLDRFGSREAILAEFKNYDRERERWWWPTPRLDVAMIHLARGDRAAARSLIEEQYSTSTHHRGHQQVVQELARKLGFGELSN